MTEILRAPGRSHLDEIEELAKARYAEARVADALANSGGHALTCFADIAQGIDNPAGVQVKCVCGWSEAMERWRARRSG